MSETIETIRADIACPQCEYNLRGLSGAVVMCPECGLSCDVAALVSRRWTKAWYQAPGFTRLGLPVAWLLASVLFIVPLEAIVLDSQRSSAIIGAGVWLIALAGWIGLMVYAWQLYQNMAGVLIALLLHVVFGGVFAGLVALIFCLIGTVASLLDDDPLSALLLLGFAVLAVGVIWVSRQGEKFAARQCIKRYLAAPPTS